MSMPNVTISNIRSGKTVWILVQRKDESYALVKKLLQTKQDVASAKHVRSQFNRSPMWFSRRKAISALKTFVPMVDLSV